MAKIAIESDNRMTCKDERVPERSKAFISDAFPFETRNGPNPAGSTDVRLGP